ncbi:cysteine desulfuration protein SufE [Roseimicrobium gellanilyticum]|uniref:Cysteine desulfuration protein SufE n=1 Tax=Roseimicrobium gellanilyticum TaxID=748857 RepID=A0A366HCT4_9BACT|nr:SufE family protein [Roseimicrobium gellanilyticum]RBP39790.1 cysteine desulfuration protein SufE [Roseimicrobium gellanilyticum]
MYPEPLNDLIDLFEHLPEQERRENLIVMSDGAAKCGPKEGEPFDLEDVRKDEECTDTVGIFLRVDEGDRAHFAVSLGPKVQTLTKAMTSILCRGLNGAKLQEVLEVPADFVPRIIGAELVRLRSQTVYYVLSRMKTAVKMFMDRRRAAAAAAA